jgi:transketolase
MAIAEDPGPAYLRLGRQATPALYGECTEFVLGRASVLREPRRVFIATGPTPTWSWPRLRANPPRRV